MTLPPKRQTTPNEAQRGFTLIELLVVLAILALAVTITAPRLLGMINPDPSADLPQRLQDKIDRMRSDAIFKAQIEFGVIDYLDNSLTVNGAVWSPPSGWQFESPKAGDLPQDDIKPAEDALPPDRISLQFSPDGTASPVHFTLRNTKNDSGWIFDVSAITGRLSFRPMSDGHAETSLQ